MEPPEYQRKWEALNRGHVRLREFYDGKLDPLDSFQGPKDSVFAYFHATYALKEALKKIARLGGRNGPVETFIASEPDVAVGIDISNTEKHGTLNDSKSGKSIGVVNSHVHVFDPQGRKDRTELTIEVDAVKEDCLDLATRNMKAWKKFLDDNSVHVT